MNRYRKQLAAMAVGLWMVLPGSAALGQVVIIDPPFIPRPPHPIPVPWPRPVRFEHMLEVKSQSYSTRITDGVAVTKVDQTFRNPYPHVIEGTYVFPLADDASVSGFSMFVDGREVKGEVLDREKARRIYRDIVSSMRDPALLEYIGSGLYKAHIAPIPPNSDVRVTLQYTQTLGIDTGLATLTLPFKADAHASKPAHKTSVVVDIRSQTPIKNVFSPTHSVRVHRPSEHEASVSYESSDTRSDRDFVLHYMLSDKEFGLALLTYRDGAGDGFFMARIAPKAKIDADKVLPKDICFVFDTSGSMTGPKIAQARDALRFCLSHLNREDRFNIIPFSHEPRPFRPNLVRATAENVAEATQFVDKLEASGGTNINDALLEALKLSAGGDSLRPYMIAFLTDGQPTIGVTDPKRIIGNVKDANTGRVRLFVFGVGHDVNTQLLDRLAEENRGARQYVTPDEDIEVKLSSFYRKVADPVLSDLELTWGSLKTRDVFPRQLPDLFSGGEIVIVGRYQGYGSCAVELTGNRRESKERYVFERVVPERDTQHDFLPRLWAIRKIGYLLDEIRLHGESSELKDEVVKLAKQYGIVTPYTAYLVTEETKMARGRGGRIEGAPTVGNAERFFGGGHGFLRDVDLIADAAFEFSILRDFAPASGAAAVAASESIRKMKLGDGYTVPFPSSVTAKDGDGALQPLVKQVGGRTFYSADGRWVEATYDGKTETRKIELFSDAYFDLIAKHPGVGKILALGERVVFSLGEVWYETESAAEE